MGFTPLAGDAIVDIGTHRNLYDVLQVVMRRCSSLHALAGDAIADIHIEVSIMFRHEAVFVFFTRWPAMQLLTCSCSSPTRRRCNR